MNLYSEIDSVGNAVSTVTLKYKRDHTSLVLAKQPDWMLQHDLDGHRPARPDCPYCKQAGLRETRAFRVPHSHRTEKTGYHLVGDFSGPHVD